MLYKLIKLVLKGKFDKWLWERHFRPGQFSLFFWHFFYFERVLLNTFRGKVLQLYELYIDKEALKRRLKYSTDWYNEKIIEYTRILNEA